ncbi:optineurin isoform X2 [Heptranchias perlo]|uniref:optineurin isoform X2 n=1 Tax=Heptranchias perlo TaxID=212740 RepID=UPI00355993D0
MMCSNQLTTPALGHTAENLNQGQHAVNVTAMNINGPHTLDTFTPEETLQQMDELIKENNELKEAIKQTNHAMKERYEELATWREKQREEREYIQNKFEEAKTRLTDFAAENEALKNKIQELNQGGLQGVPKGDSFSEGACSNPVEQDVQQLKALVSRLQTEKADLVAMNSELLLKLGAGSPDDSFVEIRMVEAMDDGELKATKELQCKGTDNHATYRPKKHDETGKRLISEELTVSQLLHMLRDETQKLEKLEHALQSSKKRVSELEKVVETAEVATQTEKIAAEQPSSDTKQEVASESMLTNVNVDQQNVETAAASGEGLNTPDNQPSNEVEVLKSQVMSLVKDLQEAQKKLDEAEHMKKSLQEGCLELEQKLANSQVGIEEMRQLKFSNEKLKLQVESLQSEQKIEQMKLADEKLKLAEEKRKLVQMQAAYDHLFKDYNELMKVKEDMKTKENKQMQTLNDLTVELDVAKKTMEANQQVIAQMTQTVAQQADELNAQNAHTDLFDVTTQLEMAEKALVEKQHKIDILKQTIIKQEEEIETVAVFKAQADVYSADFHAERAAREEIHAEKERLAEKLDFLVKENTKLKEELEALGRQSLIELQHRHGNRGPLAQDNLASQQQVAREPEPLSWEQQGMMPEHACPKCGTVLPDIDTLQIHVMDCII